MTIMEPTKHQPVPIKDHLRDDRVRGLIDPGYRGWISGFPVRIYWNTQAGNRADQSIDLLLPLPACCYLLPGCY